MVRPMRSATRWGSIQPTAATSSARSSRSLGARGDEPVETASGVGLVQAGRGPRPNIRLPRARSARIFIQLLAGIRHGPDRGRGDLRGLIDDDGPIAGYHVLRPAPPSSRPPARLPRAAGARSLAEIKPRLYSISSSPKKHVGQVHLTVRKVVYDFNERGRKGVASTMLADRVAIGGSTLRVFIQKSHGFTIPADPDAPAIMIGPGTGIAPFRAFLHERDAIGAKGRRTGCSSATRGAAYDFLYEDELGRPEKREEC